MATTQIIIIIIIIVVIIIVVIVIAVMIVVLPVNVDIITRRNVRRRAIEDGDWKALLGNVEGEILAHDGQADKTNVERHAGERESVCGWVVGGERRAGNSKRIDLCRENSVRTTRLMMTADFGTIRCERVSDGE
jgi:hypothetical protein